MKFLSFLIMLTACYLKSYSQAYRFQYFIIVDTSFTNIKNETTDIGNQIQSFALKYFFDGTIIKGNATADTAIVEEIPKYLQDYKVAPGYRIGDAKSGLTLDSTAFDNKKVLDRIHNKLMTIKPYGKTRVTCSEEEKAYTFIKTNETKQIKNWLCYKWILKDKKISDEVCAWICDSIPKAVNFEFNKQFTGGLVSLDFKRGFSYQLTDYTAVPSLQVPEILQCDSTNTVKSNFIKQMVFGHIGLDFKTELKF